MRINQDGVVRITVYYCAVGTISHVYDRNSGELLDDIREARKFALGSRNVRTEKGVFELLNDEASDSNDPALGSIKRDLEYKLKP